MPLRLHTILSISLMIIGVLVWFPLTAQEDTRTYRVVQEHQSGLIASSNSVSIDPPLQIFIPTAFTPDGDGLNDVFEVRGEGIRSVELSVYDRWGALVFRSDEMQNAWDGTKNGADLDDGVYAYEVSVVGSDNERIHRRGAITLLHP